MNIIEKEGKTVEEAIEKGLAQLRVAREEVQVEIVSLGSTGFLGIFGSKPAKVRLKVLLQPRVKSLVENILDKMDMPGSVKAFKEDGSSLIVSIESEEGEKYLQANRGAALEAIEYLSNKIFRESELEIRMDIGGFRQTQADDLKDRAMDIAAKVKQSGQEQSLEPMPPHHRKVIHQTLQNNPDVRTYAVGKGNRRKVVIAPRSSPDRGTPDGPDEHDEKRPDFRPSRKPRGPRDDTKGRPPADKPMQPGRPAGAPRAAQPARPASAPRAMQPARPAAAPRAMQPARPAAVAKPAPAPARPAPAPRTQPPAPADDGFVSRTRKSKGRMGKK